MTNIIKTLNYEIHIYSSRIRIKLIHPKLIVLGITDIIYVSPTQAYQDLTNLYKIRPTVELYHLLCNLHKVIVNEIASSTTYQK